MPGELSDMSQAEAVFWPIDRSTGGRASRTSSSMSLYIVPRGADTEGWVMVGFRRSSLIELIVVMACQ